MDILIIREPKLPSQGSFNIVLDLLFWMQLINIDSRNNKAYKTTKYMFQTVTVFGKEIMLRRAYEHNIPEYNGFFQCSKFNFMKVITETTNNILFNQETKIFLVLQKPLCCLPSGAQLYSVIFRSFPFIIIIFNLNLISHLYISLLS